MLDYVKWSKVRDKKYTEAKSWSFEIASEIWTLYKNYLALIAQDFGSLFNQLDFH